MASPSRAGSSPQDGAPGASSINTSTPPPQSLFPKPPPQPSTFSLNPLPPPQPLRKPLPPRPSRPRIRRHRESAIYRILPITPSKQSGFQGRNAYGAALTPRGLLFSTDQNGRIYSLSADDKLTLVAETRQAEAVRLLPTPRGILIATANPGKLWRRFHLGRRLRVPRS